MLETPFYQRNVPWDLSASYAFWRDIYRPDITLQQAPVIGECYKIQLEDTNVEIGDVITVQYLPPLAYYNGIETVEDLKQLTFFTGTATKVDTSTKPFHHSGETVQEIEFQPKSSTSFIDFQKHEPKIIKDKNWGDNFINGDYFVNVSRIDNYVEVDWSSEGYAGERIILRQKNSGFQALHLWGDFIGQPDWLRAGNLRPPDTFTLRLLTRLSDMGDELHWAGRSF